MFDYKACHMNDQLSNSKLYPTCLQIDPGDESWSSLVQAKQEIQAIPFPKPDPIPKIERQPCCHYKRKRDSWYIFYPHWQGTIEKLEAWSYFMCGLCLGCQEQGRTKWRLWKRGVKKEVRMRFFLPFQTALGVFHPTFFHSVVGDKIYWR